MDNIERVRLDLALAAWRRLTWVRYADVSAERRCFVAQRHFAAAWR